jgi:hypothetical protein
MAGPPRGLLHKMDRIDRMVFILFILSILFDFRLVWIRR